MMFWDSSGLVPLMLTDAHSTRAEQLLQRDPQITVWWAAPIECEGALARTLRMGGTDLVSIDQAQARLNHLTQLWLEVGPDEQVRRTARRLIRIHDLRAADSQQLAAALVACNQHAATLPFVCFDRRLRAAARAEGFMIYPEELA